MKILIIILIFQSMLGTAYAQYSLRSASGNSGIVVGTQNASKFGNINYERSSSKMGVDYNHSVQDSSLFFTSDRIPVDYPDFFTHSATLGIDIAKGKAQLINNSKWVGSIETSYTLAKTLDKTRISTNVESSDTLKQYFCSPGKLYSNLVECLNACGKPCSTIVTSIEHLASPFEERNNLVQHTVYGRIAYGINQLEIADFYSNKKDSIIFKKVISQSPRLSLGYNYRQEIYSKGLITFGVSSSFYLNTNSTSNNDEINFIQTSTVYNSGKAQQLSKNGKFYLGKTDLEAVISPRIDIVGTLFLGESKPYLNIIAAYNPTISSLDQIGWQNNYAVGPGLSLPLFPDQMLFAILYENLGTYTSGKKDRTQAISLYASVPFSFR